MIESQYQIDFIDGVTSGSTRVLSIGDLCSDDLDFPVSQKVSEFDSMGMDWGAALPMGGARRQLAWTRLEEHGSLPAAAGFCIRNPASMPLRRAGKLRLTISNGEVWDFYDAVVSNVGTRLATEGLFATRSTYSASAGRSVPVSGFVWFSGALTSWIMDTHSSITRTHTA